MMSANNHSTDARTALIFSLKISICLVKTPTRKGAWRWILSGQAGSPYKHISLPAGQKAKFANRHTDQKLPTFVNKQRNVPLFHSEIGFTFGWVFIREGKLFIRRVRKRKIPRPVCIVKQNKLFFVYDFFYQAQTKHFLDFLK